MPTKPQTFRAKSAPTKQQQRRATDAQRPSAQQRGYTAEWAKYSKQRLIEHPLCVMCKAEGYIVKATCTDHIVPADVAPEKFWDESNHRSLCTRHNVLEGIKANRRRQGAG